MKRYFQILIILPILLVTAYSQNSMKENLFSDYETLLDSLQKHDAEILSPEFFAKAVKYFKQASDDYENKEKSLVDIKKKLEKSRKEALKAQKVVALAVKNLQPAIQARDAALSANAPTFAPQAWDKSDEMFQKATSNLEDDDLEDAIDYGNKAAQLYQQCEILAIKNSILGDARTQVTVAKNMEAKKYCFKTFRNAQTLLANADQYIDQHPHEQETATRMALEAATEARHAQYLAQRIKALSENEANWEKLFLVFENYLADVGVPFHYQPKFDKGFDPVVKTLLSYISNLKLEQKRLLAENSQLEEKLNALKESEATTSAELRKKQAQEEKLKKVESIFAPGEADVFLNGDKLIIRLSGLHFPPGQATIQPEYFALLIKVGRAIREFPGQPIRIEGHTDATGSSRKNKILSEERARAVAEYLIASLELEPDQIDYYGYGDQRPIASNKTREGRAKNRRIEVEISLKK